MEPSFSSRPRMNDVQNLFQGRSQLPDCIDERVGRAGQSSIATVGYAQLTPEFLAFYRNQFHATGKHLVTSETGADDRNSQPGCYKALDHAHTRQLHTYLQLVSVWTKEFVHNATAESGLR